jgi:hypothetical protein
MHDKLRAMLNANGRTDEEAATARSFAERLAKKHGLEHLIREHDVQQQQAKAQPKGKAKASSSQRKTSTDKRLREILEKHHEFTTAGKPCVRWRVIRVCTKDELKAMLASYRAAGHTVKSRVVK